MTAKRTARKSVSKSGGTKAKRVRKNILVDVDSLRRAMAAIRSTNQSETANVALDRLAEDAAILAGIDAAMGTMPDFPDVDT